MAQLRAKQAKFVITSKRIEDRYARELRGIARGYRTLYESYLQDALIRLAAHPTFELQDAKEKPPGLVRKATGDYWHDITRLSETVIPQIGQKVRDAFDRMAGALVKNYSEIFGKILGIKVSETGSDMSRIVTEAREKNIALVENTGRIYSEQVRRIFTDPSNFGIRYENLRDQLKERGDITESRAELIARDQTLKTLGQITEARQKNAGVGYYIWSTSKDERVRETHQELEGEIFSWDSPPEPGHPGQDFQCRCVALPYISELEGI